MKSILIIDDEEDITNLYSSLLKIRGYKVTVAENPLKGIEEMNNNYYDIIICDQNMPKKQGTEVALTNNKDNLFFLMTGETDIQMKKFPGVDLIISKPFDFEDIINIIENFRKPKIAA
jgi:DNA-binding response OmpR family regulator